MAIVPVAITVKLRTNHEADLRPREGSRINVIFIQDGAGFEAKLYIARQAVSE
jgi:hypothetical protein